MPTRPCSRLSDGDLTRQLHARVAGESVALAELLALIAEFDRRRLYAPAGFPSMHAYCIQRLHLSEGAASKRIWVGRASRRFPIVLEAIASGRVHLSGFSLVAKHMTHENAAELLNEMTHKTCDEIALLVANRFPKPDVAPSIRKLPETRPAGSTRTGIEPETLLLDRSGLEHPPASPALIPAEQAPITNTERPGFTQVAPSLPSARLAPLAPERYLLKLTMGQATRDKLRRAQDLLSHRVPSGDVAEVFDRALDVLLAQLEKELFAATDRPQRPLPASNSRHIPATVKRAVRLRDGDQCTYVSTDGQRCGSRRFLEWDHVTPVAMGGESTLSNVRQRCRTHNQHAADLFFGSGFMQTRRGDSDARD